MGINIKPTQYVVAESFITSDGESKYHLVWKHGKLKGEVFSDGSWKSWRETKDIEREVNIAITKKVFAAL